MKKILIGLSLILVVAAASWALVPTEFFRAHDYIHASRIAEMTRALEDGHFPVRWTANFGYGYGMPLFEFYAPLPYYLGSLFYWLGFEVVFVIKLLFLTTVVATTLGTYSLGKKLFGHLGGLVAAAATTLAPYRAVNLFIRGALSEAWGMMAMPWILYYLVKLVRQEKKAWMGLTVWYTVLMLSHNIMTMIFVPFSLLFAVLYLGYYKWLEVKDDASQHRILLRLLGSLILATGMSSFYLLPAYFEKDLTKVHTIFSGYFHYSQHFLYLRQFLRVNWGFTGSVWGPGDGISFFLGYGQWLGLILLLLISGKLLFNLLRQKPKLRQLWQEKRLVLIAIFLLLLALALFMTLMRSAAIWQAIPWLAFVQFPWRFLGIGIVFIGLLVGLAVSLIKKKTWRLVLAIVILGATVYNLKFFRPEKFLTDREEFYYTDSALIQKEMSGILPDYIPLTMAEKLTPPDQKVWCPAGCSSAPEVLVDRVHEKLIKTNFVEAQTLELAVASYPGWEVKLNGEPLSSQKGELGNIAVEVPAGEQLVAVEFKSTFVRQVSDLLSFVSWLVFIFLLVKKVKND